MKKVNRLAVYFLIAVISVTLQGILTSAYGQWQKFIIDDNINVAVSVDVADMDGDTKLDLIVTDWIGNKLILYQNNFPHWIRHNIDANASGVSFAWSGDMDGDDTLDVVACLYGAGKMVWYENNHPTWTQHIIDANTDNADFMLVADIDGDDTLDVITAGSFNVGGKVVWYENNHPDWIEHIIESDPSFFSSLNVTDIDGDGLLDIAATSPVANKVVWYKNEGNGLSWTKYTIDNNLNAAFSPNSGDINGDGKIDLVVTTGGPYFGGGDVVWYENNLPDTIWTKHLIDANLPGATWPEVTDVDGDGTMDVIVTGFSADDVVWYENNLPDTIWTKHLIDDNLDGPRLFAVSDVDGDKINDLIVAAVGSVVWYKNPYTTVAYAKSLEVYPTYMPPQQGDTLKLSAQISNPENHQVTVHAFIQGKNTTFKDSLQLFDDGLHNDSLASDNIFGGIKSLDALDEGYFDIILRTTDLDESLTTYYGNVEHFTTIGPVVHEATNFNTLPNPGDNFYFNLTLRNDDTAAAVPQVKGYISSADTCVSHIVFKSLNYGDIAAGESSTPFSSYLININENCTSTEEIRFDLDISSQEYSFWSDSFSIQLFPIGIADEGRVLPENYALDQNYPNPFNPVTAINYALPKSGKVLLTIYNLHGEEVARLVDSAQSAGNHKVTWDASKVSSGIYFYRLQAGDFVLTRKMVLLK